LNGRFQIPLVKALDQVSQNLRVSLRAKRVSCGCEPLFEKQIILPTR
jgi:hypothetical protein